MSFLFVAVPLALWIWMLYDALVDESRPAAKEETEKWYARLFHRLYCWSLR